MADQSRTEPRFRVSDVAEVPLRGYLLRLRLLDGDARMSDLKGARLRFTAPDGEERVVTLADFAVMGGRPTQKRLDRYGLVEAIVPAREALREGRAIGLGWTGTLARD